MSTRWEGGGGVGFARSEVSEIIIHEPINQSIIILDFWDSTLWESRPGYLSSE